MERCSCDLTAASMGCMAPQKRKLRPWSPRGRTQKMTLELDRDQYAELDRLVEAHPDLTSRQDVIRYLIHLQKPIQKRRMTS